MTKETVVERNIKNISAQWRVVPGMAHSRELQQQVAESLTAGATAYGLLRQWMAREIDNDALAEACLRMFAVEPEEAA